MSNNIIRAENLVKIYKMGEIEVRALSGVSFVVNEGEMLSIMGPSGSGKSTLMNMLGCLDTPTDGELYIEGEKTKGLSEDKLTLIRGHKIGFVFQQFNLIPYFNAIDNVSLPLIYQGVKEKERTMRAEEALVKVGLKDRMKHLPKELSGGQKQRVALARAIVTTPSIILADEPTGALDSKTGEDVMDLFHKLHSEGRTIIIVTHDINVGKNAERIIRIRDGRIDE